MNIRTMGVLVLVVVSGLFAMYGGDKPVPNEKGTSTDLVRRIPMGMRAFAIETLEPKQRSGVVQPDDRVDVVQAEATDSSPAQRKTILQDVLVLATGPPVTRPEDPSIETRVVTLAVSVEQVNVLIAARNQGPLSLRRHSHEADRGEERVVGTDREFRVEGVNAKGEAVEQARPKAKPDAGDVRPTAVEKDLSTEEVVARSEASVAVVRGKNSVGSGFLVRPGVLATNAHVVQRQQIEDLRVTFPSAPPSARGPLGCELVYEDSMRDLALLSVKSDLRPLRIEDQFQFRRGQEMTVIGTPALDSGDAFENAICRGVMSSKIEDQGRLYYQLNVSLNPGNSGGPVLNPHGRVVGVAMATVKSREALAICIPSEDLNRAIKAAETRPAGESRRVLAIHDSKRLFRDLDDLGIGYYSLLNAYTKSLADAVLKGQNFRSAHWDGRKAIDEKLRPLEAYVKTSLHGRITSVCADPLVPVQVRRDIADVWSNCLEIRNQLYSPSDNLRDHLAKVRNLGLIHEKQIKNLKNVLKIDF